jgi:hypothetical protein
MAESVDPKRKYRVFQKKLQTNFERKKKAQIKRKKFSLTF